MQIQIDAENLLTMLEESSLLKGGRRE